MTAPTSTRPTPKLKAKRESEFEDESCKRIEILNERKNDPFLERALLGLNLAKESLEFLAIRHRKELQCCELHLDASGMAWSVAWLITALEMHGTAWHFEPPLPPLHVFEKWIQEWRKGIGEDYKVWQDVEDDDDNADDGGKVRKKRKAKVK